MKGGWAATPVAGDAQGNGGLHRVWFGVRDYALSATLDSGQAFRWEETAPGVWEGVVGRRWVRVWQGEGGDGIGAETVEEPGDWSWLRAYLGLDEALDGVLASFPMDAAMAEAVEACRGLRLLRQDPWECLASFLLSSTKQIPQIRDGVRRLSEAFGEVLRVPGGVGRVHTFPGPGALAGATEGALRECRIGFRAKYLKATAEVVRDGGIALEGLGGLSLGAARDCLMALPGVGPKIADCVLLFAYGFRRAFPVDVWVMKVLQETYFRGRRARPERLRRFSEDYFGPNAGYAQQYLFHHVRMRAGRVTDRRGFGKRKEDHGH